MGYGLLFKIDEENVSSHIGERCLKNDDDQFVKELSKMDLLKSQFN